MAAGKAHHYGTKLRWDLMTGIEPLTSRQDAELAEKAVAAALKKRGHRVFWG